jgi:uncharacterized hydrophobic protein (TIGR00271 family)
MFQHLSEIFRQAIDIRHGTDIRGTIDGIRNSITIKGYNVWILASAAVIASIGLDLNSQAVIIGAMLISPLMSPILGVGLSIGINDRETLIHSLENLSVAVVAALLMSTLYFLVTPIGTINDSILARTEPTLLDVGVAFFGGLAGIVSFSRKEKTNAIPGVAIATALMPPICVTGYGLAKAQWEIFFGAFYLFFLNAVFIALSTYLIVRFLNFPYKEFVDTDTKRKMSRWMALFVVVFMVPSGYLFFDLIQNQQQEKTLEKVQHFIDTYIEDDYHIAFPPQYVKGAGVDARDTLKILLTGRNNINSFKEKMIYDSLRSERYGLENCEIKILQLNDPGVDLAGELSKQETKLKAEIAQMMQGKVEELDEKEMQLADLRRQIDSLQFSQTAPDRVEEELKALYPELKAANCALADSSRVVICLLQWDKNRVSSSTRRFRARQIERWLRARMQPDSVRVGEM